MGFFSRQYKDGPGVEKDAPRKKGIARFFEIIGRDLSGLFFANLLTCVGFLPMAVCGIMGIFQGSLPLILAGAVIGGVFAGPALSGMYDTVLRALRDEPGYWWATYRRAFKQNWKASILPGILYCVIVISQIYLAVVWFLSYSGGTASTPLLIATVLNLVLFHMLFAYMWPQIVLLDQPLLLTLKNSLSCMLAFFPRALAASLVSILFGGVLISALPTSLYLAPIFGFWLPCLISCQIIYNDIDRVFHIEENIRKLHEAQWAEAAEAEENTDNTEK